MTKKKSEFAAGGTRLWSAVVGEFELDTHEELLLREACRTVDDLDRLARRVKREGDMIDGKSGRRIHPALVEARQLRIALARLLAALRLPDGEAGDESSHRAKRRVGARGTYKLTAVK